MNLELSLEGQIIIESGRLIVIDPSYLINFPLEYNPSDFICPPNIAQGANHVLFGNIEGDGEFPVVRGSQGIEILFEYPFRWLDDHRYEVDKDKLNGEYLGDSCVDSGLQVIVDASKVSIDQETDPSSYCCVKVSNGRYNCKFNEDNTRLIIAISS